MGTTNSNAINYFSPAKWVVSTVAGEGTHTTIASALSSASSGDTIVIMPGTYTENPTLKAGVNLCAFGSDSSLNNTGNVNITGKCTFTGAGTVTIYGIELQTNSDYFLAVTGSAASVVNLNNCFLNCSNNTGINYTSSSGSSGININNCYGDLGTTGIGLYTMSSSGNLLTYYSQFTNSGSSTTASSNSAGDSHHRYSRFLFAFSTSSSGTCNFNNCNIDTSAINTTCLTSAGTGTMAFTLCYLYSGSASAVSAGSGTTVTLSKCDVGSTNTNALTGAGTISMLGVIFVGSSHLCNFTTQGQSGAAYGLTQGTAPSAGCIGEQIRSFVSQASPVNLSSNSAANLTSISLTAGIWDVSCVTQFYGATTTSSIACAVTSSSASFPGSGDNGIKSPYGPTPGVETNGLSIPAYRFTLSSTTTIYLVCISIYTGGTQTCWGRISATRVG